MCFSELTFAASTFINLFRSLHGHMSATAVRGGHKVINGIGAHGKHTRYSPNVCNMLSLYLNGGSYQVSRGII